MAASGTYCVYGMGMSPTEYLAGQRYPEPMDGIRIHLTEPTDMCRTGWVINADRLFVCVHPAGTRHAHEYEERVGYYTTQPQSVTA